MTDPTPENNVNDDTAPETQVEQDSGQAASVDFEEAASSAAEPAPVDPLEQALFEKAELQDQFLRVRAEMDNFRKRTNRERDEERKYAGMRIVSDLLPAIDNLKRAVEAGKNEEAESSSLTQGVEMVLKQIEDILDRNGAKPITAVGQEFDPNVHEALQQVPSAEHPPMTVLQELEQGYQMHERVIRPSKVIVSSAPPAETE